MAGAAELKIVLSAIDQNMSQILRKARADVQQLQQTYSGAQRVLSTGLGVAVGLAGFQGITASLQAAKDAAIGFNSQMQQGAIGWGATLKNETLGAAVNMDNLKTSIRTGLDFAQMNKNTRYLVNMGVAAKDVKDTYLDIANVAAGTGLGKEAIDRITWALGQMKAKGLVSAEEMTQQLGELIPAWQILADYIGKTVAETQKMAEKRQIAPETFYEAFRAFSKANFGDMLKKQAGTFEGAMNIIRNASQYIVGISFKPIFDQISALAVKVAEFAISDDFANWATRSQAAVVGAMQTIRQTMNDTASVVNQNKTIIIAALAAIADFIMIRSVVAFMRLATVAAASGAATIIALGPVGLAIAALIAATGVLVYAWQENWGNIQGTTARVSTNIATQVHTIGKAWHSELQGVADTSYRAAQTISTHANSAANAWKRAAENIAAGKMGEPHETGPRLPFTSDYEQNSYWNDSVQQMRNAAQKAKEAANEIQWPDMPPPPKIEEIGKAAKSAADLLGVSASQMVSYLVSIDPAAQEAAAAVGAIQLRIVGLQDQQEGLQDAMKGAQAVLQGLQDQASRLSEALSNAKSRLDDLANVKLTGMGDMDKQMFQIEQAIKRIKLAQLGQDVSGLQPLTAEARAFAATLPASVGELEKMLEILRLQKSLRYDEQLKAIQEAAKGAGRELSFDEAMKQIGQTKDEIGSLNNQIAANKAAIDAQQATIRGLQDAMDGVSKAMAQAQRDLQGAEKHQTAVNDVLKTYYEWLIEVRPELIKAGDEHILQALRIDEATRNMVDTMKQYVKDQSDEATKMINAALDAYNNAKTQMAMGLLPGGAPNNSSGEPAGTAYSEEGAMGQNSGVNSYGGSYGTSRGGNGTRGAAPAAPNVYITVQGTVISERDLVTSVRNELIKAGKRNVNVGLS